MFGEQIKKLRLALGMSQAAFADELFVSRQMISNFERNVRVPDLAFILRLTERFDIELTTWLQDWEKKTHLSTEAVKVLYWKTFLQLLATGSQPSMEMIRRHTLRNQPALSCLPMWEEVDFWQAMMEQLKQQIDQAWLQVKTGPVKIIRDAFLPAVGSQELSLQFFYQAADLKDDWRVFIGQACQHWAKCCFADGDGQVNKRWQELFLATLLESLLAHWFGGTYLATVAEIQGLYDQLATRSVTELIGDAQ